MQNQVLIPQKVQQKEKKGLSTGAKIAIIAGGIGTVILADFFMRGKASASKAVINKIETLLKNKKVQEHCRKNNIDTDINRIKEKNIDRQLEFLGDLLDIIITLA